MKGTVISIRIPSDLLERLDAATQNRAAFIKEAIEQKLNPALPTDPDLSCTEKRKLLKDAKTLNDYMKDAMLRRFQKEGEILLDGMPRDEFLKLVAGRLPKESIGDSELEQEVLSLRKCLEEMPGIEDITRELNKMKGLLFKTERERDLNLQLLKHSQNKATLAELMETIYRGVVEYVVDLVARNSLPGLGEGGGLTDRGYAEISRKVKQELDGMALYRK